MGFGKRAGWRKLHPHKNECGYFLDVLHRHVRPPPHRLAYDDAQAARPDCARSPVSSLPLRQRASLPRSPVFSLPLRQRFEARGAVRGR